MQQVSGVAVPPQFKALIDTGAQSTMISSNVVSALNMSPVGQQRIQGVGPTANYHNAYLFHVSFIVPALIPGAFLPSGPYGGGVVYINPNAIYGAEITSTGGVFDVLLGMDVISGGSLKIEGNGTFSFSI
jgi:hypothetical protein